MDKELRQKVKDVIKISLENYVSNFEYTSTHPLDILIPTERRIRSLVGGLETSMGTKLWEPIAKVLALNNGFEILEEKLKRPKPMPNKLQTTLNHLITAREDKATWVGREEIIKKLRKAVKPITKNRRATVEYVDPAAGSGVDIFFKKGGKYYAFDTKTVKPNVGSIKSYNKQILEWYAYAIFKDPGIDFSGQIAYPYNPGAKDFWAEEPHKSGSLQPKVDALVEDEFWDFISGHEGTFRQIMDIFEELENEGFGKKLSEIIKNNT